MMPGHKHNRSISSFRISVKPVCVVVAIAVSFALTAAGISSANEYIDEAVSKKEIGLFSSISDTMSLHGKLPASPYHLFEPKRGAMIGLPTTDMFSQDGKSDSDVSWLFNRFNRKSKGLIILPVLNTGVRISYKLDF